MPEGGEPYYQ